MDTTVRVRLYQAIGGRVVHRCQDKRRCRLPFPVTVDDGPEVQRRQDVPVEHDCRRIDPSFGILESPAGPERRPFHRITDQYTVVGTILQQVFDLAGLVGQAENDLRDPGALHQVDLVEKERPVGDRYNGLRCVQRKRPEAGPLTSCKNQSLHGKIYNIATASKFLFRRWVCRAECGLNLVPGVSKI